jgi:uncharacterized delta-60 repeat protein
MNGQLLGGLARLNPDGTLDDTFAARVNDGVFTIVQQPDGKLLIGGMFLEVNAQPRKNVAQLNPDGTLDTTFDTNWGPSGGWVETIAVQGDKVLIGGHFDFLNRQPRDNIARLNPNGSLDESFTAGSNGDIHSIVVQPDDKIIVGGSFTTFGDDGDANNIFRLFADGTSDLWFNYVAHTNGPVHRIVLEGNGDILLGGAFTWYMSPHNNIVRINSHGGPYDDGTFVTQANGEINTIVVQPNGRILISGAFTEVNSTPRSRVAQLKVDGSLTRHRLLDHSFNAETNGTIQAMLPLPNGKILIGGDFTRVNGQARNYIALLNADGSLDPNFAFTSDMGVRSMALQKDGKILVGRASPNPTPSSGYLIRLNADGSYDPTFFGVQLDNLVRTILVQPDGKIVIGGAFRHVNAGWMRGLARLESNGTVDRLFNAGVESDSVSDSALQQDGKIVIAGSLWIQGQGYRGIARLHTNGSLDTTFDPQPDFSVNHIVVQRDNKLLLNGYFRKIFGQAADSIVRLNADGTLDTTFTPRVNHYIRTILPVGEGKVLIHGGFTNVGGELHQGLALLNADGSVDSTFTSSVDGFIRVFAEQADGKILVGGYFNLRKVEGQPTTNIVRLHNPSLLQ